MPNKTVVCGDGEGKEFEISVDQLRWRPSAYGIVIRDGAILLSPQYNGYDLPGGGVELGEMPEETVIREIEEETGIIASDPRLIHCLSNFYKLTSSDKGLYIQSILMFYVCEYSSGTLSVDNFTNEDKQYTKFPEWYKLKNGKVEFDREHIASSYDWRQLIPKAI